jgi:hypothetical protein
MSLGSLLLLLTVSVSSALASPLSQTTRAYRVANTNGEGVYLRRSPSPGDRLVAWPEGTVLYYGGVSTVGDGVSWLLVVDPAANIGYVPAQYLVPETSMAPTAPPATSRPSAPRATSTQLHRVSVSRAARDVYRDDTSRIYIITRLCASLALGDDALLEVGPGNQPVRLIFSDGQDCSASAVYRANAQLTRAGQDLYRDDDSGGYLRTQFCYEYVYGEDALILSDRVVFRRSECRLAL